VSANLLALGALALWASLATLGVTLAALPPFLLTGLALMIGSLPAWPRWRQWKVPPATFALGVVGLFGYHALLFIALRLAPAVEANLLNYLWPLLIVVMAPVYLPGVSLRSGHLLAAAAGFAGAALAILGSAPQAATSADLIIHATGSVVTASTERHAELTSQTLLGYAAAAAAGLTWASYSLLTRRVAAFPTAAVGGFALVSGLLSLLCHLFFEHPVAIGAPEAWLLAAIGLGPMGAAFYLWDRAIKLGDARVIGLLSYLTPLGSTALLLLTTGRSLNWRLGLATALIVGSAALGLWASRQDPKPDSAAK
jgi:drug/metabolite transporter (DMT)-like permease